MHALKEMAERWAAYADIGQQIQPYKGTWREEWRQRIKAAWYLLRHGDAELYAKGYALGVKSCAAELEGAIKNGDV